MFKRITDYKSRTGKSSDHCRHFMFFEKKMKCRLESKMQTYLKQCMNKLLFYKTCSFVLYKQCISCVS